MSFITRVHGSITGILKVSVMLLLGVISILGSGGGGGGSDDSAPTSDVTGFWSGTWSSDIVAESGTVAVDLLLIGSSLSGTFYITGSPCITTGDVNGTLSGNSIEFTVTSGGDDIHISGTLSGNLISGTYSVSIGLCAGDRGSYSLTPSSPSIVLTHGVQYTTFGIRVGKTAIGDLNGDGLNDAIAMESGGYGQRLLIYYQNSLGELDDPIVHTLSDTYLRNFTLGDVNSDGTSDIVVSGISISALSGYLGRVMVIYQDPVSGDLTFPGRELIVNSNSVGGIVTADLNSDDREDIAVLGSWELIPGMGNIAIFYQDSLGDVSPEVIYDATPVMFTGELQSADMDSDGDMDLILQSGLLELAVIKQDSTQTPPVFSPTPDFYTVQTSYWPSFDAFSVGDLNDDGLTDIAVLDPGNGGSFNLFYQNASGTLDGPSLTAQPFSSPYGLALTDIDLDGLNELLGDLVSVTSDPTSGGQVYVFYPDSIPPYADYAIFTFGTVSGGGSIVHEALSVADVTNDDYPDVVVTWADEGLYVLRAVLQ